MADQQKPFGRYHDVVLLLLGFLFTTIAGGSLTFFWQKAADKYQRLFEHRQSELKAATQLFDELSKFMDRRLYRMRQIHTGLKTPNLQGYSFLERRKKYRVVLHNWNENLNRNLALTERYFGKKHRRILEERIQETFRKIHNLFNSNGYPKHTQLEKNVLSKVGKKCKNIIEELKGGEYNFYQKIADELKKEEKKEGKKKKKEKEREKKYNDCKEIIKELKKKEYNYRKKIIDELNECIRRFDISLIKVIQSGNVGHFLNKPSVDINTICPLLINPADPPLIRPRAGPIIYSISF